MFDVINIAMLSHIVIKEGKVNKCNICFINLTSSVICHLPVDEYYTSNLQSEPKVVNVEALEA